MNNNESLTYRLEEMSESMEDTIDNVIKVKAESESFIEFVKAHDTDQKYESFIESMMNQIENYSQQIEKMSTRRNGLLSVIDQCHNDAEIDFVVTELLNSLGLFQ